MAKRAERASILDAGKQIVFISHAERDRDLALALAEQLDERGVHSWLAEQEVAEGESLSHRIRDALEKSHTFVMLIGPRQSAWTHFEWSEILKRAWRDPNVVIVPVIVDNAQTPGCLRDMDAVRIDTAGDRDWDPVISMVEDPEQRGVARTAAGDKRLKRRLARLHTEAMTIAANEPVLGAR